MAGLYGNVQKDRLQEYYVRFQVLTAASMMFRAVFWVVLPCKMIVDLFLKIKLSTDVSEVRTASIIRDE
jgi:hypothetical protein